MFTFEVNDTPVSVALFVLRVSAEKGFSVAVLF